MMTEGIWVHVGLLVLASAASIYVWTRDPKASAAPHEDVTVWNGRPEDVQRIAFESTMFKISLESREDTHGRWFFGTEQPMAGFGTDAGVSSSKRMTSFASGTAAQKLALALAPFKAEREIGRIESGRANEFGFKDPGSILVVAIGGKEHRLTMGGPTPNALERYVRDDGSGYVYAVRGDFVRELESGETGLFERELHDFQDADTESAQVIAGGKTRNVLRRGPTTKRIWADPDSPDKADETAANWLTKVDRLRPSEYVDELPARSEPVVRIEYKIKGSEGIFFELVKVPGTTGKSDYYVRTEHTRLWAKAHEPWAEQVEQDLASVLRAH